MSKGGEILARFAEKKGFAKKSGRANLKASAECADNSSKQAFAGWMGTLHETDEVHPIFSR
jgi:hypothetical protein